MRTGCCTNGRRRPLGADDPVLRSESTYDLFRSDLPDIVGALEREYPEIIHPAPAMLTLYFYDADRGAPNIDPYVRLRSYARFDPAATTFDDIKALPWQAEKKCGHEKRQLGRLDGLPDGNTAWRLFGGTRRPNILNVSQQRHFAIGDVGDESHRITVDVSRSVFKIADHGLESLGDIAPRVEIRLPKGMREDSVSVATQLRSSSHSMPLGDVANYFQFLLRRVIPIHTHMQPPAVVTKFAVRSGRHGQVSDDLFGLCASQAGWHFLLPSPRVITRARRYHVCEGPRPGATTTVVETPSGRYSLMNKNSARTRGSAPPQTFDIDSAAMPPEQYIAANGLTKINEFTKLQRKIPIALTNCHAFQFSIDRCVDPSGRSLNQIEIKFIGSTDGRVPCTAQVLDEVHQIGRTMLASPLGKSLESALVSTHAFFARDRQHA